MYRSYVASLIALVLSAFAYGQVAAQQPGHGCTQLTDECMGSGLLHYGPVVTGGPVSDPHVSCEGNSEPYWHLSPCEIAEEDLDVQLAYSQAVEAAKDADLARLIRLGAGKLERYVVYNRERNAVQLRSCDATQVVASLRVPRMARGIASFLLEED